MCSFVCVVVARWQPLLLVSCVLCDACCLLRGVVRLLCVVCCLLLCCVLFVV